MLESRSRPSGGVARSTATIRRFIVESILGEVSRIDPRCRTVMVRHNRLSGGAAGLYSEVPLSDYIAGFEAAAAACNRPDLGLEAGWHFHTWEVGPVYHLLASARTLREALGIYQRFQTIWQNRTTLTATPAGNGATRFSYRIDDARIWPRRQDAEFFVASYCAMVRDFLGPRWTPLEVAFEHDTGARRKNLMARFRCQIGDLADANSITIANDDLDRIMAGRHGTSDTVLVVVERHLFELLGQAEEAAQRPLPVRLAEIIAQRLGQGSLVLDDIAAQLGLTPRTLRRHLAELQTSYGAILSQERRRKAENLLASGEVRIEEVAIRLGYTSHAAFTRAYRDWTGTAPIQSLRAARRAMAGAQDRDPALRPPDPPAGA